MANLYATCPILLPDSNMKVQEDDEQKLSKMTGLTRLFAAIASSDCPPGSNKHPFGLENIWKTLVAILICEFFAYKHLGLSKVSEISS